MEKSEKLSQEEITLKGKKLKAEYMANYMKAYRKKNRKLLTAKQKAWMLDHPGKGAEYQANYWNKRATKQLTE